MDLDHMSLVVAVRTPRLRRARHDLIGRVVAPATSKSPRHLAAKRAWLMRSTLSDAVNSTQPWGSEGAAAVRTAISIRHIAECVRDAERKRWAQLQRPAKRDDVDIAISPATRPLSIRAIESYPTMNRRSDSLRSQFTAV